MVPSCCLIKAMSVLKIMGPSVTKGKILTRGLTKGIRRENTDDLHQSSMQSGLSLRGPRSLVQNHPLAVSRLASLSKGRRSSATKKAEGLGRLPLSGPGAEMPILRLGGDGMGECPRWVSVFILCFLTLHSQSMIMNPCGLSC